jgi:hypothetical protein
MHAITPRLFSKDVYSVPLRALRLRVCVRLDLGGGGWGVTKMFPDVQKIFRTYNNFSHNFSLSHVLRITWIPLKIFCKLNLPKSALEIYLKFLMSNYQGCCTPPPPVSFKQTLSDLLFMYFTSQNIVHFAVVML